MQILVYLFAKINLAQIFHLCLFCGLMLYIFRVKLSNVHKPSLPSVAQCLLFTAPACAVVNNKYFAMSWK